MKKPPYVPTFSIVAGGRDCNASCPFCAAKMTQKQGPEKTSIQVNWRNFHIGAKMATCWGALTALITSTGEATLWPNLITEFLLHLRECEIPLIKLQTNGILLLRGSYSDFLKKWRDLGLTTISVSVVSYNSARNKEIYQPDVKSGMNLELLIKKLHSMGFSVRLTVMLIKGYIDSCEELSNLIDFAKRNKIEQVTIRPIEKPDRSESPEVSKWVEEHALSDEQLDSIRRFLVENGKELMDLDSPSAVYEIKSQNIGIRCCSNLDPKDPIKKLIFFPDGHVRYDWTYQGATLF